MRDKVIICFFGVVSRSIEFTYKNLEENLINVVKQNYDVDIYIFNNNVENIMVDGIRQNNEKCSLLQRTFFEEKTQTMIDNDIKNEIESKQIICKFRDDYDEKITTNAMRQMYSENQVGLFLEKNIQNYQCAVVCGPDYYLLNKVNLDHIKLSINNESEIYTSIVNDAQGYTNGFYIGALKPMIKILKRYSILNLLLPVNKDYEYLLKKSFELNEINRLPTDMFFVKIRSNKKISRHGFMQREEFTLRINKLRFKLFYSQWSTLLWISFLILLVLIVVYIE
jgi:hypothetical protein